MSLLGWWYSGKGDKEEDEAQETTRKEGEGDNVPENSEGPKDPTETSKSFWNVNLNSKSLSQGMTGLVSTVKGYASTLSSTVGEVSVFNELNQEQEKFARKRRQEKDAAVPPWVGYNEEEEMKKQIIDLSADQRNFLRPPPSGVQFHFDFNHSYPVAMALLEEDQRLQKMRFEYVPKKISEVDFWRNLFYRISLIKQAVQITSANKEENDKGNQVKVEEGWQGESPMVPSSEDLTDSRQSPPPEFASDELVVTDDVTSSTIKQELQELGMSKMDQQKEQEVVQESKNVEDWEAALQEELDQLTLEGGDGDVLPEDTEGWEKELEQLLEHKS